MRSKKPQLTTARVKSLLYWDAEFSHFAWKADNGRARAGMRAGSLRGGVWRIGIDGHQYSLAAVAEAYGQLNTDPAPIPLSPEDSALVRDHKLAYNNALTRLKAARAKYAPLLEKARVAQAEVLALQNFAAKTRHELAGMLGLNPN